MAPTTAHSSHLHAAQSFGILDCDEFLTKARGVSFATARDSEVLRELSQGQSQRRVTPAIGSVIGSSLAKGPRRDAASPNSRTPKTPAHRRPTRIRRPQVNAEIFEPLGPVPEETSSLLESEENLIAISPLVKPSAVNGPPLDPLDLNEIHNSTEVWGPKSILEEQVQKHLAGQFEWLMTYPGEASPQIASFSQNEHNTDKVSGNKLYGCNLLPVRRHQASQPGIKPATDMYTLLATLLNKDTYHSGQKMDVSGLTDGLVSIPEGLPPPYPGTPLKVSEVVTLVEQAFSPSLTVMSDRSPSLVAGSSRTGSFSIPRIEDSLEELDKLEEELEAVHDLTRSRGPTDADKVSQPNPATDKKPPVMVASKRASIAGYSATVRVKPSQKARPSLRRSASLTLREKRQAPQESPESQMPGTSTSRGQASIINRLSTPKHHVRSTKPPTVPKFELPGEAVARRLKEQREARQAQQQAEAQRSQTSATKPRTTRTLSKPTFELPGEAISRRKREEREAKLKAEEEELKRRREFKARPVRHSMGPATLPRETLASRARQTRGSPEIAGENGAHAAQRVRESVGITRPDLILSQVGNSPQTRGRNSTILSSTVTEGSRGTSTPTGSVSGKRNSVSLEELHAQRQRGREILVRDKCYTQERENGKRERETAAKMAREEAAERSRMASREWAEKKRGKEVASKLCKAS